MSQTQSDRSKSPGQTKPRSGLRARDLENTTETEATAKKKKKVTKQKQLGRRELTYSCQRGRVEGGRLGV